MENAKTTLLQVQATLLGMFSDKTILIGHSLESDMKALKVSHIFFEQNDGYRFTFFLFFFFGRSGALGVAFSCQFREKQVTPVTFL